jgi:hypothetical protein
VGIISEKARIGAILAGMALAGGLLCAPLAQAAEPLSSFAAEECPNAQLRFEDNSLFLPDCRAYELVSPVDKNGGAVGAPEAIFGGGVLQAAADGEAATYSSSASFAGGLGAPAASQYIARRMGGEVGWASENVTQPTVSGAYPDSNSGVPYQLFSTDLARGLLLNGRRCAQGEECPRSYSLRESEGGALAATPAEAGLRFAGASPDLRHLVFAAAAGLYAWPGAGGLTPIGKGPGSALAAPAGAISADGSRVYFTDAGNLYLREGALAKQVDDEVGGGGEFQAASADGAFAFFSKEGHLYRYEADFEDLSTIDLTPGGGVVGVLGASADGSHVYYATASGIFLWDAGTTTEVAPGAGAAEPSDFPPATGAARVSADGAHLAFLSTESLTGYDNTDQGTGEPDSEVFLFTAAGGGGGTLACASCNPSGEAPQGPATIPGAIANGAAPGSTQAYKPRDLSASERLFFDSSDQLVPGDGSAAQDVYEWEAAGIGGCAAGSPGFHAASGGCLFLISSGSSPEASTFIDASADGRDAFFLSGDSLLGRDPGSADLYDARELGGVPEPQPPIPCEGDACQSVPSPPEDPSPGTLVHGSPNPPVHFPPTRCPKGKHRVRRHGKSRCVGGRPHHRRGARAR